MNLLFEEDGVFKAGSVLSSSNSSYQVELPSGRRTKVKGSHVLLQFDDITAARLLEGAQLESSNIDLDFLWEAAPQGEFGFRELALDYFGRPSSLQEAALLIRLQSAPVYFHRKGRGRFRPAPPETLKAALAAIERKRLQDELRRQYVDELKAGRTPAAIASHAVELLVGPDRASIEFKALEQAASELQTTPLRLLLASRAIESPYRWHVDSFLALHFPHGTGFPAGLPPPTSADDLPLADVCAFSIDDSATTEIDDAFSVTGTGGDRLRIGIHIAAPALALQRGHALDAVARARMSTVYAPGLKFTMLPPSWVDAYSLVEGQVVPVVSLYADVDARTMEVIATESRVERLRIESNLRHDRLDEIITDESIADASFAAPHAQDLSVLWRFARSLLQRRETVRGRPEPLGRVDYSFEIDGDGEHSHVAVRPRRRGAPLDLLVAELMIFTNSTWGRWLAERGVAGVYRSQSMGRVRMSTSPAAHEGIGVSHYAWSSSPLRRYVDLVNQRQLIACIRHGTAPYAASDADLFAIVSGFDSAYGVYAEFQERMERYWGLRWLRQEGVQRIGATVVRGDVLRLAGLPFVTRLPGLPMLPRGQQLELDILGGDEVDLTLEARVHRILEAAVDDVDEAEDVASDDVASDTPAPASAAAPEPASAPSSDESGNA